VWWLLETAIVLVGVVIFAKFHSLSLFSALCRRHFALHCDFSLERPVLFATMLIDTKFDIKVALIGYVSVGKTTILNALLRDKYGEVAMGRATASVNNYCVSTTTPSEKSSTEPAVSASEIHDKTMQENARLRISDTVEEAWFNVTLNEAICDMRDDSRLVVVDIPGINEAGTSQKYKDFVINNWHTFDCVVVVMDGRQGVNTEEQVELLKFAKSNCDSIKSVPVIVLCNKIEDPEEGEQSALISETRESAQKIFQTGDQLAVLKETLEAASSSNDRGKEPFPSLVLLPVSAIHAFIYQAGARCGFDKFQRFFDKDLIEKIGKDNYGTRKWRRLDMEQKIERAYSVVSDSTQCQEGLDLSNFDKFVALLSYCIGGKETQRTILKHQIDMALSRLVPELGVALALEIQKLYTCTNALKLSVEDIPIRFWTVFDQVVEHSFALFKTPKDVSVVATPLDLLLSYAQFVKEVGWKKEFEIVCKRARELVSRQAIFIVDQFDYGLDASPSQMVLLYGSLLLQANESFFYRHFGLLKIVLEDRARSASARCNATNKCRQPECTGQMVPVPGHLIKIWQCSQCEHYATEWGSTMCGPTYMSMIHERSTNGYPYEHGRRFKCSHCMTQTSTNDINALEKCIRCLQQLETISVGTSTVKRCNGCRHLFTPSAITVCVGAFQAKSATLSLERGSADDNTCCNTFPKYELVDGKLQPKAGTASLLLSVPDSLENPNHFGHLIWMFGRIVKILGVE
jgi:GTPase SAR1 family protein